MAPAPPAQPEPETIQPAPKRPKSLQPSLGGERNEPAPRQRVAAPQAPPKRTAAVVAERSEPSSAVAAPPQATVTEQRTDTAAAQEAGGTGVLRINSRPWSRVYVDGRLLGNTPQTQLVLGAGRHTVTLVNPEFGFERVLPVQIKAGETLTKIVDFSVPE